MRPRGCHRDNGVADCGPGAVDDPALFDNAHAETGKVVITLVIHAGQFGGLAADERAAGLLTPGGDTGDNLRCCIDVQVTGGVIVEEKERLGALHHDVVDAHPDKIDADGVVPAHGQGKFELGTDAVGAGDQYGFAVPDGEFKKAAKAPESRQHTRSPGLGDERFDTIYERIASVDVHAGVPIRQGGFVSHVMRYPGEGPRAVLCMSQETRGKSDL